MREFKLDEKVTPILNIQVVDPKPQTEDSVPNMDPVKKEREFMKRYFSTMVDLYPEYSA